MIVLNEPEQIHKHVTTLNVCMIVYVTNQELYVSMSTLRLSISHCDL